MSDSTIEGMIGGVLSARKKVTVRDQSLMPAAVLLLMYPKDGKYCILLQKRTDGVEHHKGEISLPGGSKDPEDRDFLDTALREVHEEMGIRPEDVTVLGDLDDVVTRTQFGIRVFVGTIPYPYPFKPSPVEIAEVLEVPVVELMSPANRREEARWVDGRVSKAYSYAYKEHLIFGATAQIVTQFLELLPGTLELSHSERRSDSPES
ncbi:MAG: CoA pyrophosphatase [Dehalococcoidia bacterium]|nr:CoA pyrophosphatase [Dehalococcoidia bacterium]